jgi:hypothetical protein
MARFVWRHDATPLTGSWQPASMRPLMLALCRIARLSSLPSPHGTERDVGQQEKDRHSSCHLAGEPDDEQSLTVRQTGAEQLRIRPPWRATGA